MLLMLAVAVEEFITALEVKVTAVTEAEDLVVQVQEAQELSHKMVQML